MTVRSAGPWRRILMRARRDQAHTGGARSRVQATVLAALASAASASRNELISGWNTPAASGLRGRVGDSPASRAALSDSAAALRPWPCVARLAPGRGAAVRRARWHFLFAFYCIPLTLPYASGTLIRGNRFVCSEGGPGRAGLRAVGVSRGLGAPRAGRRVTGGAGQ